MRNLLRMMAKRCKINPVGASETAKTNYESTALKPF